MCHYVSFLVDKSGKCWFGDLESHSGIAAGWGLKPGEYREAEWTEDDEDTLTVRVEEDETENFYRAQVLAKYPTLSDLLRGVIEGRADGEKRWYKDGKLHRDGDKPAVIYADGEKRWYKDGKLHRDGDKPAVIFPTARSGGTKTGY